jgi:hypothetical protein
MIDKKIQTMGIQDCFEFANRIACIRAPELPTDRAKIEIANQMAGI